jgi:E3 ubiquitin-protein ligase HERC1
MFNFFYFLLQSSITGMKWDPTGHMLLTCARGDSHVKVWTPGREGLILLHTLYHTAAVTVVEWCTLLGKGEAKSLMLARYVCRF